jgi:hypothetical protein
MVNGIKMKAKLIKKEDLYILRAESMKPLAISDGGKEEPKHPKVLSEKGNELFFDEQGNLIKEEPKQEVGKEFYESADKTITVYRQETLEEAAKIYTRNIELGTRNDYNAFVAGANYQAKRMYSEEEVKQIIEATLIEYSDYVLADIPEWFKQFKKK